MAISAFGGDALDITTRTEGGKRVGRQIASLAPGGCEGTDISPKSASEKFFGGDQIAGLLKLG